MFLINLPIIAIAFISGWFLVPKSKDPEQGRLDPPGAILSIIGISSLVFGLIQAPEKGWAAPQTLIAFAIAFVVLTLFVFWELHTDEPMLDIRFFRNRSFSTGSGGMMLVFLSMYGVMFLMTQYFQLVLGYSPFSAAVRFLPMAPIMIIVAPCTPWLSARFGANRVVGAGMVLHRHRLPDLRASGPAHRLLVHPGRDLHAHRGHGHVDVADDRGDHVGGAATSCGRRVGDERRDTRARGRPRRRGARQHRRVAVHQPSRRRPRRDPRFRARGRVVLDRRRVCTPPSSSEVRRGARSSVAAQTSFVDGLHVAAYFGVALCLIAAVLTTRYLPRVLDSRRRAELTGRRDGEHRGARSRRRAPGAGRLARDELAHDGAGVPPGGA